MNIENIKADIELLRKITDDWNRDIPEMEKEIVLSMLRRLYTDIKYTDAAPCTATPMQQENTPAASPQKDVAVTAVKSNPTATEEPATAPCTATPAPQEKAVEQVTVTAKPEETPAEAAPNEEIPAEPEKQTAEPQQQDAPSSMEQEEDAATAPESQEDEPQQQIEEPVIKRQVNRNLIRTLYSDNTEMEMPEKPQTADQRTEQPAPAASRTQTKVLGDVINQGPTLSDTLQKNSGMDMAEKIASADTRTLRGAIGLNDRFLMIRDLFGGNAGDFDAALLELERFDNLEEALLYINDNFDWNPECEGARMMVELLVRKLS